MKKYLLGFLSVVLVIGLVGCGNTETTRTQSTANTNNAKTEMTESQIINAVKNAKFDNHPQKTISEYFDLLPVDSEIGVVWDVQTDNIEGLTGKDLGDKDGVICVFSIGEIIFFWSFTYDKKTEKTEVIQIDTSGEVDSSFTEKTHINDIIDGIVEIAEK